MIFNLLHLYITNTIITPLYYTPFMFPTFFTGPEIKKLTGKNPDVEPLNSLDITPSQEGRMGTLKGDFEDKLISKTTGHHQVD